MSSYPSLNVLVEFNKTPKTQECPIEISTIQWGYLTDNVLYGNFKLPDDKYITITIKSNTTEYGKKWLWLGCEPKIYIKTDKGEIVDLSEYKADEYYKHEDYWRVDLMLEEPDGCHIFAKEINALKYEYDVFAVVFKSDYSHIGEFHNKLTQMSKTEVIGYFYDPVTKYVDLEHEGYNDVLGNILKHLVEEEDKNDSGT